MKRRAWRIPALVRAVVVGLAVGLLGTFSWARLIAANIEHLPNVPWATPAMGCILVAWWLYFVKGRGWPAATAGARRRSARANRVPDELWGPALGAGVLGLVATLLLQGVLGRLVTLPQQQDLDPSQYPVLTVFAWVVMGALVAGVVEETAFRGYIQGGIERRHGLTTAILVTGSLFGLSHFTHPEVGLVLLPFYLAVAAVYGLLAAATNSTYPSIVLHVGGNVFSAFSLFTQGRSEWQLTAVSRPTIWQAGIDGAFLANLAMLAVAGIATVMAYRGLFRASRSTR
ncbi:MAG: CPBP family intramembrane metalloprotease [Acidobacteria bacterium]|nr:MAG: CPBP family intramembrane metalloprotease [Acidobacteriota bacterium]